ncbi:hypothetical protein QQS21_006739 [Conoideocrella luteorostrata]|uniref:CUE domain-containing protein n=1 Tax=Conoideocrella luteorostrata TaxID=1105319 RepID=A0AAJ0CM19_9HYPO|nr:hypothetical protein QQS21_006739 [Conoideocrella luteorostrata]
MSTLPPLAPFPKASWQTQLGAAEWNALILAWQSLCQAYLRLSDEEFMQATSSHASLVTFTYTFVRETALTPPPSTTTTLLRPVFHLASRLLRLLSPSPQKLLDYSFLGDFARMYPKKRTSSLVADLFSRRASGTVIEASLTSLKKLLIPQLDSGIKGDLKLVESSLVTLNPLLHASPHACTLLLAGSDFFDGLVTCFKVMNPPLRKAIIATTYLCVLGMTESEPPKWSMLNDHLFALNAVADAHKQGPLNVNDSLVAELVTETPLLKVLLRRAEAHDAATGSLRKRITALESFKKGPMTRPKRLTRRKIDKGKDKVTNEQVKTEMHVHRMSQITQVQDLFPDLGTGFVSKCLEEYGNDVEQVVANLLAESLPPHLATANRSEPLSSHEDIPQHPDLAPRSTPPPQVPTRRNIYDDDDFDRLSADVSKISFGKKPQKNADELLQDKSTAPNKAAIMSALAAFDSDDDERDDTYDAADVGGTVDTMNQEADGANDGTEEVLFRAYQMDSKSFDRGAGTRRDNTRARLREETGMTDEAIEGWAVMLARNPQQRKRLEAKYSFAGQQAQLERTAWRASPAGSGTEDSDFDGVGGRGGGRGGRGGRGGNRGRGRGGRGGNVAGPTGEKETEAARRNKEAHKGSRANHNRRDGRARKMARGGFAG